MMRNVFVRRFLRPAVFAFGALALAPLAWAQNTIENLGVTQSGGQVLVRVTLKSALAAAIQQAVEDWFAFELNQ